MQTHPKKRPVIRTWPALAFGLVAVLFGVACESSGKSGTHDERKPTAIQRDQITRIDRWAVEAPMQRSVENAVIKQCVLYEYHFQEGSPRLTALGRRDVQILARHYRGAEWVLSVRQGGADDGLYEKRLAVVKKEMEPLGVKLDELTIVDAMPGGSGLASTDARRIRKESIEGAESLSVDDGLENNAVYVEPVSTTGGGS